MVATFGAPDFASDETEDGENEDGCFGRLALPVDSDDPDAFDEDPIVAVLDLDLRHIACSKGYAALVGEDVSRLVGMSLRSIVRDGGALDDALAAVLLGEIDYRSVELEVLADGVRVALHVAMVRRDDVTPRGVVLVAHPVPSLSAG
jgi:PAS domain-containing protein